MKSVDHIFARRKWQLLLALSIGLLAGAVAGIMLPPEPRATLMQPCDQIAIAPDGRTFVTVRQSTGPGFALPLVHVAHIVLWDAAFNSKRMWVVVEEIQVKCVVYSRDSRRIAVLLVAWANGKEPLTMVRTWNTDDGEEGPTLSSSDWHQLSSIDALFFSREGDLLGFCRPDRSDFCRPDGSDYEIWDIGLKRPHSRGSFPEWCSGLFPSDPIPANSGVDTIRMARNIEGRWDLVLPQWCPLGGWGGAWCPIPPDRIAATAAGNMLIRTPSPNAKKPGIVEVHNLRDDLSWKFEIPTVADYPSVALSPGGEFLAVGCCATRDERLWPRLRRWLGFPDPKVATRFRPHNVGDSMWILDTTTGIPLAQFPDADQATFSPSGELLAVVYADRTEIWDVPLPTPWRNIVGVSLAGFLCSMLFPFVLKPIFGWKMRRRSKRPWPWAA